MADFFGQFRAAAGRAVLALSSLIWGCSTDTSGLERRDPESAGQGGAAAVPSRNGGSGQGGSAQGFGGARPPEAETGVGSVNILHGVVDGGRLFICLRDIATGQALTSDVPGPPGGLGFGEVYRIAIDWDVSQVDVEADLFAATLAQVEAAATCSGLLANRPTAPPPFSGADAEATRGDAGLAADAATLPIAFPREPGAPRSAGSVSFAPGTLRPHAHYALVSTGCATLGVSPNAEACGVADGFGSFQSVALVELGSQAIEGETRFGLQFINASRAVRRADLVLQASGQTRALTLTNDVQFGVLRPRVVASVDEPAGFELHIDGATLADYSQSLPDTLAASALAEIAFQRSYLLAFVGPSPRGIQEPGLAPPRFVLIEGRR